MSYQDTKITVIISPGDSQEDVDVRRTATTTPLLVKTPGNGQPPQVKSPILPNPESMTAIQQKVSAFQLKMEAIADVIDSQPGVEAVHLRVADREQFFSQFYIDKAAMARLNTIAMHTKFSHFGVFFGLEDPVTRNPLKDVKAPGLGRLTCCFVGIDDEGQVLEDHFPPTPTRPFQIMAEETWPPPPPPPTGPKSEVFALSDSPDKVAAFFNPRA